MEHRHVCHGAGKCPCEYLTVLSVKPLFVPLANGMASYCALLFCQYNVRLDIQKINTELKEALKKIENEKGEAAAAAWLEERPRERLFPSYALERDADNNVVRPAFSH
jgi:hypothetical protein